MTVSECARIQGYLSKYYNWHIDEKHNYFMLGNTMSICVFQRLLIAALRCIGFHVPDPWLNGDAQEALREDARNDFHPPAKWDRLHQSAIHFRNNPPPAPVLPPNCGSNRLKHSPNSCGHIYDPETNGQGLEFQHLPSEWKCPSCGTLGSENYSDENAISPYGDMWVCTYTKPRPLNKIDRYMTKDHNLTRTIPNVPNNIPHIKPIVYEEDQEAQHADDAESPRSTTSSRIAASEAPSYATELGSDDESSNQPLNQPAESADNIRQRSTAVDPLLSPLSL